MVKALEVSIKKIIERSSSGEIKTKLQELLDKDNSDEAFKIVVHCNPEMYLDAQDIWEDNLKGYIEEKKIIYEKIYKT